MSRLAKYLLVSTALSPILGAVAVDQIANGKPWTMWGWWLGLALLLVLVCHGLLRYAARNVQRQTVRIVEIEHNSQEMLAFLIAYLFPFLSSKNFLFTDQWTTGVYILVVLCVVLAHAGALHFNPVMGLIGYHFVGMKDEHGVSRVLISKKEISRTGASVQAVRLGHHIYLEVGDGDA